MKETLSEDLFPDISPIQKRIHFAAKRMVSAMEEGRYEEWEQQANRIHEERCQAINRSLKEVEALLSQDGGVADFEHFSSHVLDLPFQLRFELEENGIVVAESDVELCHRLAGDILDKKPEAFAVVFAFKKECQAKREMTNVSIGGSGLTRGDKGTGIGYGLEGCVSPAGAK